MIKTALHFLSNQSVTSEWNKKRQIKKKKLVKSLWVQKKETSELLYACGLIIVHWFDRFSSKWQVEVKTTRQIMKIKMRMIKVMEMVFYDKGKQFPLHIVEEVQLQIWNFYKNSKHLQTQIIVPGQFSGLKVI